MLNCGHASAAAGGEETAEPRCKAPGLFYATEQGLGICSRHCGPEPSPPSLAAGPKPFLGQPASISSAVGSWRRK